MPLNSNSLQVSKISFCNKEASNIRTTEFKKMLIEYLQEKYDIKIGSRSFVNITPNILRKSLETHQHLISLQSCGNPYFFFLTKVGEKNCCFYIDQKIVDGHSYPRIIYVQYRFADYLYNDTLLNGELIKTYDNKWSFLISDLNVLAGKKIETNIIDKLGNIYKILTQYYQPDPICDICPLQVRKIFYYSELGYIIKKFIPELGYNTKGLCFHTLNTKYDGYIYTFSNDEKNRFFGEQSKVKEDKLAKSDLLSQEKKPIDANLIATLQFVKSTTDDLYQLYCHDGDQVKEIGYAAIPTQRHSHQLRMIFEKNPGSHYFTCRYSKIFRKWIPIEEVKAKKPDQLTTIEHIIRKLDNQENTH